jgi:hypothetical protein
MQRFKLKQKNTVIPTNKKLIPSMVCFYGEIFSMIHEGYLGQSYQNIHLNVNLPVLHDGVPVSYEA